MFFTVLNRHSILFGIPKRRFCLENPSVLDCEDLPSFIPPDYLPSAHRNDLEQGGKLGKRKRDVAPFWEQAQEYIEDKIKENGRDLNSDMWRTYV